MMILRVMMLEEVIGVLFMEVDKMAVEPGYICIRQL